MREMCQTCIQLTSIRREELDRGRQPLAVRRGVPQATPEDVVEVRRKIPCDEGSQERLPDPAQSQDRHLPTSLVRRPLAENVMLGLAAQKPRTSGAPPQDSRRASPEVVRGGAGAVAALPVLSCTAPHRPVTIRSNQVASKGVRNRGASSSAAFHSACASSRSRPAVKPPTARPTAMSACRLAAPG